MRTHHRPSSLITLFAPAALLVAPVPARAQWLPNGTPVCTAPYTQEGIAMRPDGTGGMYVAWHDERDLTPSNSYARDIYLVRLTAGGMVAPGWPAGGRLICDAPGHQSWPGLAPDGAGGVIVCWQDDRVSQIETDVYAQHVLASGTVDPAWTPNGVRLTGAPYMQYVGGAVSDGAGGAIVMWEDYRDNRVTDMYAQRVTATGAIAPGWPTDGAAVCVAPSLQSYPHIVSDGAGGAIMSWVDQRDSTGQANLYALRMTSSGVAAPGWTVSGTPICTAAGDQWFHDLAADGAGGAVQCWIDTRSGHDQVYAQRMTADGAVAPGWTPDGVRVADAVQVGTYPKIATDGAGGAIMTWVDRTGPGFGPVDVYAMRMTGAGSPAPGWTPGGVAVCAAPNAQTNPVIAADGSGGAIIAWQDFRGWVPPAPTEIHIYALRLTASGTRSAGWLADGTPLCTAPGFQQLPVVAADEIGGAFVAWIDSRNATSSDATFDLYATRVIVDGPVPALVSNVSAEAVPDRVRLLWFVAGFGPEFQAAVYRREEPGVWTHRGPVSADGTGRVSYDDLDVAPGHRYGYRLGYVEAGTERFGGEVWVDVPAAYALALAGFRPNPARAAAAVEFSLASAAPARLEMVDVAGRRVLERSVGSLGGGRHVMQLDEIGALKPGLYLIRLTQGGRSVAIRAVVAR